MKTITFKLVISAVATGLAVSASAQSALITFDDLADSTQITNGYSGFNWNNLYIQNSLTSGLLNSGYTAGVVSPDNVAFNHWGDPASITSTSMFTLVSGYFTAAWNNNLNLEVQGYNGTALVYDQVYVLNTTEPEYLVFNFSDITDARFSASGGVDAGLGGFGTHIVFDNLTVSSVPEPSTLALASLGGLSLLFRRRRK